MGLLACMCMQEGQHDVQFNFEMIYQQLKEFLNTVENGAATMLGLLDQSLNRAVIWKAFEILQSMDLLHPLEAVSKCPKEYRMMRFAGYRPQIIQIIATAPTAPPVFRSWAVKAQ